MTITDKLLYSREDAAYCLSISPRSIDYYIAEGLILTRRLRGRVLIPIAELKRFASRDLPFASQTQAVA